MLFLNAAPSNISVPQFRFSDALCISDAYFQHIRRRSGGRNKPAGARGHVKRVRCEDSGVLVPKDKAVKRFQVRNIVDASAIRDLQESSTIDGEAQTDACCQ